MNLGSKKHPSVVKRPSVILQRVTSSDQRKRLVAAAVPQKVFDTFGGFVGENHTVILEQKTTKPALTSRQLAQLLQAPTIDRYFRCISGATNVSIYELNQLRLPEPRELKRHMAQGCDIAEAARRAMEDQR